jgi:organic radical activating enzyme
MREITFELTNFCENSCKYCSTNTVKSKTEATYLEYDLFHKILTEGSPYDRVIFSGGEPLAHPGQRVRKHERSGKQRRKLTKINF